jgi:hypothetical protein
MDGKSPVLDGVEIVRSTNFVPIWKLVKNKKNKKIYIKIDVQRYFNMNIMLNSLDWQFRLLNLRYRRKTKKKFCNSRSISLTFLLKYNYKVCKYLFFLCGDDYGATKSATHGTCFCPHLCFTVCRSNNIDLFLLLHI